MTKSQPKPTLIIGLVGLAGSGKDTVAAMLLHEWTQQRNNSAQLSFAEPVREMAVTFLRAFCVCEPHKWVTDYKLKDVVIPEVGLSPRRIMQTLGTDWAHTNAGRDVWIRSTAIRLRGAMAAGMQHVVISDVRFELEAEWVRNQGGMLWQIDRPGVQPVHAHVSESEMAQIRVNRVLPNSGTLADLQRNVGFELARAHYEAGLGWAA